MHVQQSHLHALHAISPVNEIIAPFERGLLRGCQLIIAGKWMEYALSHLVIRT
jgi:hypothetical protein